MALTGVDAQISVTRTADYAKELSNNQKRSELMQDYSSAQRKAMEEAEKSAVPKLERKEEAQIARDRRGSGQDSYGREKKARENEEGEEPAETEEPELGGAHRIDIRI